MAQRMEQAALSFQDNLVWATKTRRKYEALVDADFHLERLKLYNRLAVQLRLSNVGQYEHLSRQLDELGRLLGGWMRSLRESHSPIPLAVHTHLRLLLWWRRCGHGGSQTVAARGHWLFD